MAKWFGEKSPDEREEDAGKAVEAKFKGVEDSVKELKEKQEQDSKTLKTIADSLAAQNKRQEDEQKARDKAAREEQERKARETNSSKTAEQTAEELLNDPGSFIANAVSSTTKLTLLNHAKLVRAEVLGDQPYYHGEIKKQTDSLIEGETNLALRGNPAFVLNAYKIAVADNMEKINSGDIKTTTAMHSFSDSSSRGNSGDRDAKPKVEYEDNKSKYAASQMGITDEDVVAAAKTRQIKGLEVTL